MTLKSLLFRVLRMLLIIAMLTGALSATIPLVGQFLQPVHRQPPLPRR